MAIAAGTTLSCSDDDCGCRIQVLQPCPHGDSYTCACGHALTPVGSDEAIPPTPGA
ncbi:metallothionein [Iamia majanohamensis]|uniref:Metallothionein n=1 Tax=Iamia majanohamensis TaxID=467976 RepID=A0AAF0BSS7_9ACTN|nr:metallothionein [Iamia majanohamensis]WCO65722.1 metallothionein [Iamia majanohamensis]